MLNRLRRTLARFLGADDGPTAAEYAVMVALIILSCIVAIDMLSKRANQTFTDVGTTIGSTSS
jgi:pilus assembly protein Flp/PilA